MKFFSRKAERASPSGHREPPILALSSAARPDQGLWAGGAAGRNIDDQCLAGLQINSRSRLSTPKQIAAEAGAGTHIYHPQPSASVTPSRDTTPVIVVTVVSVEAHRARRSRMVIVANFGGGSRTQQYQRRGDWPGATGFAGVLFAQPDHGCKTASVQMQRVRRIPFSLRRTPARFTAEPQLGTLNGTGTRIWNVEPILQLSA
jgi:hypothetical protein